MKREMGCFGYSDYPHQISTPQPGKKSLCCLQLKREIRKWFHKQLIFLQTSGRAGMCATVLTRSWFLQVRAYKEGGNGVDNEGLVRE